ncbi:MAG: hypothetical protein RLZ98_695 [Pseudomonadota bacterium]|jgi:peptidoglycan/xylan/chitin deacetylase (PgdA/CDA1 family)
MMKKEFDQSTLFPYRAIVDHPAISWPGGKRMAVWVVPNIEHFHLELTNPAPDVKVHSRRDYGNRVGVWRLIDSMVKYGIRGTVALNSEVIEHYPRIIEACRKLNWEFMGHGRTNSVRLTGMTRDQEAALIRDVKTSLDGIGQAMRGWLGSGLMETWNTLDVLKENGVEYVADWVNDDLPYRMNNGLYSIPYSIEINDNPLFFTPSITPADFERMIRDTFDVLYAETEQNARVMCIALHPFLIGAPHRIRYLDNALAHIAGHEGVWFATGSEIIDAYRKQVS